MRSGAVLNSFWCRSSPLDGVRLSPPAVAGRREEREEGLRTAGASDLTTDVPSSRQPCASGLRFRSTSDAARVLEAARRCWVHGTRSPNGVYTSYTATESKL